MISDPVNLVFEGGDPVSLPVGAQNLMDTPSRCLAAASTAVMMLLLSSDEPWHQCR